MCQKASKPLHSQATEVSSRSGLIYFDSCVNSPFNYLLLRLEKHLERTAISGGSGGVGARGCRAFFLHAKTNQQTVTVGGAAVAFDHILRHTSVSALGSCQRAADGGFFFSSSSSFVPESGQTGESGVVGANSACATVEAPRVSLGGENRVLSSAPLNKRATSVWQ